MKHRLKPSPEQSVTSLFLYSNPELKPQTNVLSYRGQVTWYTRKEENWSPRKLAQKNLAPPSFRPHPYKYTYRTSSSSLLEGFVPRQTPRLGGLSPPAPTLMPRNTSLSKNRQTQGGHQLAKLSDDCSKDFFFFFYSDLFVMDIILGTYLPSVGAFRLLQWSGRNKPHGFVCHLHKALHVYDVEGSAGQRETLGKLSIQKFSRKTFGKKTDHVKQE